MSCSKTLLIVDDIPLMREMLSKYLECLGLSRREKHGKGTSLNILEAENGIAALKCLATHKIDIVFLDLMMPEMDGMTFLEVKKKNPNIESIPVVACSALGEKSTVDRALALGAVAYIMKPFSLKCVESALREALPSLD